MCRFSALTAILVTIALGSHGHPAMDIRAESNEAGNCTNYRSVGLQWTKCIAPDSYEHWQISTGRILSTVDYTCRNQDAIITCMAEKFGECSTWSTIQSMMGVSFEFCNGNDIPIDLRTFLEANAGNTIPGDCFQSAFEGLDERCTTPDKSTPIPTLEGIRDYREGYLNKYVACFKDTPQLDEKLGECDDMTRRTVFAFLISSISAETIGINFYSRFEDMESYVAPSMVEQVEQLIEQRNLFY